MLYKYTSASRLGKAFIWLSAVIVMLTVAIYAFYLSSALALDPHSF